MTVSAEPIVRLADVSKRFGGTQALDSVTLELLPGEVHALVGENGAGKSTLGKIVGGVYSADSGTVMVHGEPASHWDAARAQRAGIVLIAQELALVPELTIEQNVFLGRETSTAGLLRTDLTSRFEELEREIRFNLPPRQRVSRLSIAEKQKVEIMRALARDAQVIVMDEPTSSLSGNETEKLHGLIRKLRERGTTIVYISHYLDAVLDVADRVTVMREGRLVKTSDARVATKDSLVSAMLGREFSVNFPVRSPRVDDSTRPSLIVTGISTAEGVAGASLEVRPGEVVGLLGLVGSGRSEIARAIYGADQLTAGRVYFGGAESEHRTPRTSIAEGLMLVPEERHSQGLVLVRSIRENISLSQTRQYSRFGFLNPASESSAVKKIAERLDIRPLKVELPVSGLSGGNQQKAVLAKALLGKPSFIILDEPTRGVDIGAKSAIYDLIVQLADEGVGVLLISSEHEEVLALSHRAYLVRGGATVGEVDPQTLSVDDLLRRIFDVEDAEDGV